MNLNDKKPRKKINKEFVSTIHEKFEHIEKTTRIIARGHNPAAVILGPPGIGETHTVIETLKDDDEIFLHYTGYIKNVFRFYKVLYENRNSIIVFDDSRWILRNPKCHDLLLSATDHYTNKTLSYDGNEINVKKHGKVPQSFKFRGKIIFIANLRQRQIDPALWDRVIGYDMHVTKKEMEEYIKHNLKRVHENIPYGIKLDVYKFLIDIRDKYEIMSFRMFTKSLLPRLMVDKRRTQKESDWKRFIIRSLKRGELEG